ncbi:protein O-mannosyl-transferase family [Chondrinema litorale]|uniref:protein O-mannosyl-transferase family n=1 Tax=Chondrinema litorale TaxID=2994555 RepID=UPI002543132A|nr:DUF2723 domain-containing protein [Chondrinema litorale]UZS00139.1 DUF2723 domain-containing protein [Chondrinema litorale]
MENDDGYLYAYLIKERTFSSFEIYSSKLTFYLPFCKAIYHIGSWFKPGGFDAYMVMCIISIIFSALSIIILYLIFNKTMRLSNNVSILGCLFLLFSYGYWRYSSEADVYALSFFLIILIIFLISKNSQHTLKDIFLISLIASIAVAMYKPNFIPLFLIFSFYFIFYRKHKTLFVYLFVGGGFIITWYTIAFFFQENIGYMEYLAGGSIFNPGSPFMTLFVIGSNIVAVNFMFGIPEIAIFIQQKYPYNIITEEIFAAKQNGIFNYVAVFTLLTLLIISFLIFYKALKNRFDRSLSVHSITMILWIVIFSSIMAFMDPNSPEPWLILLLPITILVTIHIINPLFSNAANIKWLYGFIFLILVHNTIGGIMPIYSKKGDYIKQQTDWLVNNSQDNDLIVTLGSNTLHRYLMYNAKAQTISLERNVETEIEIIQSHILNKGKVYLTSELVMLDPVVRRRSKDIKRVDEFLEKYKIKPISSSNNKVYLLSYK